MKIRTERDITRNIWLRGSGDMRQTTAHISQNGINAITRPVLIARERKNTRLKALSHPFPTSPHSLQSEQRKGTNRPLQPPALPHFGTNWPISPQREQLFTSSFHIIDVLTNPYKTKKTAPKTGQKQLLCAANTHPCLLPPTGLGTPVAPGAATGQLGDEGGRRQ